MSERAMSRVAITRLPTGVPGLDEVLGGGLPEYSFTLVAGAPGTGKTTLAHQLLFSLASPERRALYFSVVGEPMLKMLRYQQQMAYFDPAKVGDSIRFINLIDAVLTQALDQVLADIVRQVEETSPGLVVLDSFHNIAHLATGRGDPTPVGRGGRDVQGFVQRLALHLTSWQATTFLLGNYAEQELRHNPVFTLADGVLWLSQVADHNSVVRKLQVVKMRGQEPMPGLHTVRLDQAGLQVFPRISIGREQAEQKRPPGRAVTGVPGLDALVGGARRVVIDSVSGFELALAPDFRQDFRESLYRLVGALTGTGITVLMTMEIVQTSGELRFSPYLISFLADDIILLRHVEIAGQLRKSLAVIKMRNGDHSKELWLYDITEQGLIVRQSLRDARGTGTVTAELGAGAGWLPYPGLTERETLVLRALRDLRQAPADELARRSGVAQADLTAALDRLVSLGYAARREEGGTVYRPSSHAL